MVLWVTRGLLSAALLLFVADVGAAHGVEQQEPAGADAVRRGVTGRVDRYEKVSSRYVDPRNVDVWVPPGYAQEDSRRFPVIYMHDGQNLFDPAIAHAGIDWGVDETMTRLIRAGAIREAIVVGVWNTPKRLAEYLPQKAVTGNSLSGDVLGEQRLTRKELAADAYLRFLVRELKPFIDSTYRTRPGREDTFTMGSSAGALVSIYALTEYPEVFGGAGGVSTHWPIGDGMVIGYLEKHLPAAPGHLFYFDHGTATLDQWYEPYQRRVDALMRRRGYTEGVDWITRKYQGAEHDEAAWRARVDVPLTFFLRK